MIVPMKKVAVITQNKDAQGAIAALGALGVVHIQHQDFPKGKTLSGLREDKELIDSALTVFRRELTVQELSGPVHQDADWARFAHHIIDLHKRIFQCFV